MDKNNKPLKKYLPSKFRSQVVETLASKGLHINKQDVTDVLGGKNRNQDLSEKILVELTKLAAKNKSKIERLKNLKSRLR